MAFKLAHASDLHLEYRATKHHYDTNINVREQDGYDAFDTIIQEMIDAEVDALVVAGDVYHGPHPHIRSIVRAQEGFRRLADAGIKVYILNGNHDSADILGDIGAASVLDDAMRGIHASAEPYRKYEIADGVFLHVVSHHIYSLQADTMAEVKPVEGAVNIFSTHGSVIDPLLREKLKTPLSPREIVIPDFLLNQQAWDYRLLGHIHERGFVGSKTGTTDTSKLKTYYNGSLIRRGFSDAEVPLGRGWTLWTIEPDGTFKIEPKQVKQRIQTDFAPIDTKNLTSGDITDLIVANLKRSQEETSKELNLEVAPLLRQKLLNITPAKYAALNFHEININSEHALQWTLQRVSKELNAEDEITKEMEKEALSSGDMVEVYDSWIKDSSRMQTVQDDLRDQVTSSARTYIKKNQEALLEAE